MIALNQNLVVCPVSKQVMALKTKQLSVTWALAKVFFLLLAVFSVIKSIREVLTFLKANSSIILSIDLHPFQLYHFCVREYQLRPDWELDHDWMPFLALHANKNHKLLGI